MDEIKIAQFRRALATHHDSLLELVNMDSEEARRFLGGQGTHEVLQVVSKLKNVINNIDKGEFGQCQCCEDEVELERLEIDCTTSVCLDHYSPDQIRALENDLELAAKVQKQLLPSCVPSLKNVEIAFRAAPLQVVGGDYYDFFNHCEGSQGIAIADVMGKGLSASMLMSNLQASLRILGPESDDLPTITARLNKLFCYNISMIRFISIFLATFNPDTRILEYCNAGHHPPLLWLSKKESIEELNPTGPAIGLMETPHFYAQNIKLASGDLLVMYTDGLIEARNANHEEFSEKRLARFIKENHTKSAEYLVENLLKSAKKFSGKFHDDVTIVILKVL